MNLRVGLGYDIHPLTEQRRLILGGVEIAHHKGLAGHSDSDALIHAICDAMLGALGEGDIGSRFPSTDPSFKDISSVVLLEDVRNLVATKGYSLVNLDAVIIAQAPRLGPHLLSMSQKMAAGEIDVLLLASPENLYYVSGYQTFGFHNYQLLGVPLEGKPFLILRNLESYLAQRYAWIDDVIVWDDTDDPAVRLLVGNPGHRLVPQRECARRYQRR